MSNNRDAGIVGDSSVSNKTLNDENQSDFRRVFITQNYNFKRHWVHDASETLELVVAVLYKLIHLTAETNPISGEFLSQKLRILETLGT